MPSLLEAIETKYGSEDDPQNISLVVFAPKASKIRHLARSILVLNDCDVDSAGDEDALQKMCSQVVELDLSHNKLMKWNEIATVLKCSPAVTFLNLSFNDLPYEMTFEARQNLPMFPNLRTLILIKTNISWDSVWFLLQRVSVLEELHLSLNKLSNIDDKSISGGNLLFNTVTRIMFDGNPISDWKEIIKLGIYFPELKHLSLSDTLIENIPQGSPLNFKSLQTLSICNTNISEVEEFTQINNFPSLKEVRLTGVSFWKEYTEHERRQRYIALLPKITKLNGGAVISTTERDAAERAFIRYHISEENPPKRYHELVMLHGKLNPLVDITLKPKTRVKLRIFFGETSVERNVKLHLSVAELKSDLESLVGMSASSMILYFVDVGIRSAYGRERMRFPQKQLYSYNMHDGDEIYVEQIEKSCPA